MEIVAFPPRPADMAPLALMSEEVAREVRAFHESFPMYTRTPLRSLKNLATTMGLKNFLVKDESYRFGLNAFKVLGSSYAIGSYIADLLGAELSELPYSRLVAPETRAQVGSQTFITTTDGNHGRGVAWTARELGQHAVVYMPRGTRPERLANIRHEGADASITDMCYDDTVRMSAREAAERGWVLVQDTSWPGYEDIPRRIMQGYATMALEAYEDMMASGERPTHIFLQAGVGSMAAAVAAFFTNVYPGAAKPTIVIVEPNAADCIYQTADAADGELHATKGDLSTMMAGLACGEVCTVAWELLERSADYALRCDDTVAARAMRVLGAPLPGDARIISGESGASTSGAVISLMLDDSNKNLRDQLGLDEHATVLCISTEGATDVENYRRVVWDGRLGI